MSIIHEFIKLKFNINYTLLKIGYMGEKDIKPILSKKEIIDYSLEKIKEMESGYELIVELISSNDDIEFNEKLNKLVKKENIDYDLQIRKWIVFLVKDKLNSISKDYFEALMELTELWVSLGIPSNCPHVIQGRNNTISPEEYYTKENYKMLLEKNIKWVNNEIININMLEGKIDGKQ